MMSIVALFHCVYFTTFLRDCVYIYHHTHSCSSRPMITDWKMIIQHFSKMEIQYCNYQFYPAFINQVYRMVVKEFNSIDKIIFLIRKYFNVSGSSTALIYCKYVL